jgi:hypothetical protein|tara:strand:+ start:1554 stop:1829 length:276 start_codon:yes stop_codon:yes gene_type:complete
MMSKIYAGMFKKKNEDLRHMTFVKLDDVPPTFLSTKIKDGSKDRTMPKGMELVWDLDAADFRVFNYSSQVGDLREIEMSDAEKTKLFELKA